MTGLSAAFFGGRRRIKYALLVDAERFEEPPLAQCGIFTHGITSIWAALVVTQCSTGEFNAAKQPGTV
jgi:hypothetical protein